MAMDGLKPRNLVQILLNVEHGSGIDALDRNHSCMRQEIVLLLDSSPIQRGIRVADAVENKSGFLRKRTVKKRD